MIRALAPTIPVDPANAASPTSGPRPRAAERDPNAEEPRVRLRSVEEGRLLCGPETLQINLGNACQLNCTFCWNHSPFGAKRPAAWHRERMSDEHLDAVLSAIPRLRPGRVLLSGRGEPLLHPGAARLLATLQRERIPVSIQTNGVGGLSPEAIVSLGVDQLLVDISAATTETYEAVHPGRGHLFARVVERLERMAELRGDDGRPRVSLVAIIHRPNAGELLPLVELAARVGASSVQPKGMEMSPGMEQLMLSDTQRDGARRDLRAARQRAEQLGIELRASHLDQLLCEQTATGSFTDSALGRPCYMGWYYLRVTCDGRLMFCCKDKLMGHLDGTDLYRAWRSPAYHLQRIAGRDGDQSTGLFDDKCRACSNFARNRQIAAELDRSR